MKITSLQDFDLAVDEVLAERTRDITGLTPALDEIVRAFELHVEPACDWVRTERFLYLHHVYDLLPEERIERLLEQLEEETPVDRDAAEVDIRRMCEVWIQQWRGRTARVRELIGELDDARANARIWLQLIGATGHAGDVASLRREYDAFCEVHADDRVMKTYCDCIYVGFSMHLGVQDTRLDLWELEVRVYELPTVLRVSANAFLGVYYRNLGKPDHAWRLDVESLKLAEWFGHPRVHAAILLDAASSELTMGYIELAYDKLLTCRGLLEQTSHPYVLGRSYLEEARALLALGHYIECVSVSEEASRALRMLGHEDSATIAELIMVLGRFLSGDTDAACVSLDNILARDIANDMTRWQGLATRVFFHWHRDGVEAASKALRRFHEELGDTTDEFWFPVVAWIREHLLGEEPASIEEEEDASRGIVDMTREWRAALRRLGGEQTEVDLDLLRHSMTGSLLAGLVELYDASETEREPLDIDTSTRSFTFAGETTSLRRRASLWTILLALAKKAPRALSVDDLFEIGWPGEGLVDPIFASRRVYWAVGELRRLGLYKVIVTMDPGYALAASVAPQIDAAE